MTDTVAFCKSDDDKDGVWVWYGGLRMGLN